MQRNEFEQILKRALELQSMQKHSNITASEEFNLEDLHSAAERLGITPEILEAATQETKKRNRRFHFAAAPDDVREAFLKHFLMNETGISQHMAIVRVDHDSIKIGSNKAIRVYYQNFSNVEAFIEFSPASEGGTNVSWSGNSRLATRTRLLAGGWPLLILVPLMLAGLPLAGVMPLALAFFCASFTMLWAFQQSANGFDKGILDYFHNCKTLEEIDQHKKMKAELHQLREKQKTPAAAAAEIMQQPIPELYDDEENEESPVRPPGTGIRE